MPCNSSMLKLGFAGSGQKQIVLTTPLISPRLALTGIFPRLHHNPCYHER